MRLSEARRVTLGNGGKISEEGKEQIHDESKDFFEDIMRNSLKGCCFWLKQKLRLPFKLWKKQKVVGYHYCLRKYVYIALQVSTEMEINFSHVTVTFRMRIAALLFSSSPLTALLVD